MSHKTRVLVTQRSHGEDEQEQLPFSLCNISSLALPVPDLPSLQDAVALLPKMLVLTHVWEIKQKLLSGQKIKSPCSPQMQSWVVVPCPMRLQQPSLWTVGRDSPAQPQSQRWAVNYSTTTQSGPWIISHPACTGGQQGDDKSLLRLMAGGITEEGNRISTGIPQPCAGKHLPEGDNCMSHIITPLPCNPVVWVLCNPLVQILSCCTKVSFLP